MFADAYPLAVQFTKPTFQVIHFVNGSQAISNAAMVVVNKDGWFLTAAHVLAGTIRAQQDIDKVLDYDRQVADIKSNPKMSEKGRRHRVKKIDQQLTPGNWVRGIAQFWVNLPTPNPVAFEADPVFIYPQHDVAVGRLLNFRGQTNAAYPVFCDPASIKPGTSLCKLGFPFPSVTAEPNPNGPGNFKIANLAFFPNEGIFTRTNFQGLDAEGAQILFMETSTPGLQGQSGGPVFDRHGRVWGIQSQTIHFPLGFEPPDPADPRRKIHQFLNVGLAVHPSTLVRIMRQQGVGFEIA